MKKNLLTILFFPAVFVAFFLRGAYILDSDFGWHLKIGEFILRHGVPHIDPFTYTMPSFPFVDHEWLSNVLIYLIYNIHPWLLSGVFAIFPVAAFLIHFKKQSSALVTGVFALCAASLISLGGNRVQLVSWLMLSILLKVILDENLWRKWRFTLPILVLLWTNLHGSFALSILFLTIFIVLRIFKKLLTAPDILVLLLSFAATFVNPYGPTLWSEVFSQIGRNNNLYWSIREWLPGAYFFDLPFFTVLSLGLLLFYKYHKNLDLTGKTFLVILFLMGASSIRHIPLFLIGIFAILTEPIYVFLSRLTNKTQRRRAEIIGIAIAFFSLFILFYKTWSYLEATPSYPSDRSLNYLKEKVDNSKHIFSEYGWGGYLEWKSPGFKVFIDGRMPSWRWRAPFGESDFAFGDYNKVLAGDYERIFRKFDITYVYLDVEHKKEPLIDKLKKNGWEKIYEDFSAILYAKKS